MMKPARILVFRTGHLGDTLVALPAFWAVRGAFPDAHLTLLSNADARNPHYVMAGNILPEKGLFDSLMTYPNAGGLKNYLKLFAKVRSGRFDAVVYLMNRSRTAAAVSRDRMFFRAAGIGRTIGMNAFGAARIDFGEARPLPELGREADFLLGCLEADGIAAGGDLGLCLTADERARAGSWLTANCPTESGARFVGFGPGSKWESKIWPRERFREVGERLISERGVYPLIFGGPEDRAAGDELIAAWGVGANAAGEFTVRESAAALERCQLYVGNDTGTMHLAAAVGTKCVAVFASVDYPGRWSPLGTGNAVFRGRVDCEGCHLESCPRGNECVRQIGAVSVAEAALERLGS